MKKLYFLLVAMMVGLAANADVYLMGTVNDWTESSDWKFVAHNGTELKLENVTLPAEAEIKIKDGSNWYGVNSGTTLKLKTDTYFTGGDNCKVATSGTGTLYFDTNSKKVYFDAVETVVEDSYCLWASWAASSWGSVDLTKVAENQYEVLGVVITGSGQEFGVKKNGVWYASNTSGSTIPGTITLTNSGAKNISAPAGTYDFSLNASTMVLTVTKQDVPDPVVTSTIYRFHGNFSGTTSSDGWDEEGEDCTFTKAVDSDLLTYGPVHCSNPEAQFGIRSWNEYNNSGNYVADTWYRAPQTQGKVTETTSFKLVPESTTDSHNVNIAEGDWFFTLNPETMELTCENTGAAPTIVYLMGIDGDWETGIEAYEGAEEINCAVWTIPSWAEGTKFKFKMGGTWYGYNGDVANNTWDYCSNDPGAADITLPEAAIGQTVTLTFAVDTKSFKAEWQLKNELYGLYIYPDESDREDYTAAEEQYVNNEELAEQFELPMLVDGKATWTVSNWPANGAVLVGIVDLGAMMGTDLFGGVELANGMAATLIQQEPNPDTATLITLPADAEGADITFVLDAATRQMTATWVAPQKAYLMGIGGDWEDGIPAIVSAVVDNCAVWTVSNWADGTEFKVKYHDVWYGMKDGVNVKTDAWVNTAEGGTNNDFTYNEAAGKTVEIKFAIDTCDIYVNYTSGVESVEANDAEAVYYNLQGVRVDNPTKGLFIEVRGNKTNKVVK